MEDGDDAESSSIEADVEVPASHEDHVLIPVDLPPPPQAHDAATMVSNTPSMFDNKKAQAKYALRKYRYMTNLPIPTTTLPKETQRTTCGWLDICAVVDIEGKYLAGGENDPAVRDLCERITGHHILQSINALSSVIKSATGNGVIDIQKGNQACFGQIPCDDPFDAVKDQG